ncbi:MAG: FHA domain-containing protein [Anaerolineaceae bacterium]|nr:FHA domain-containing protein [Anaerolineaceae bacterium]
MSETPNIPWVIVLRAPQMPEPLKIRLEDRITLGRIVEGDTLQPDIDLSVYGAEEFGVSRRHLAMHTEDNRLWITDLESGNGTFINGERLRPDEPRPLSHGDTLQIGRMRMETQVIVSPMYGSGGHKQPSIQMEDELPPGRGQLVLIVEDDIEVAKVLSLILERNGYTTRISREVIGAIRLFNQKRPSAVVLDLMLPDLDGLEFCRYVRRDTQQNDIPIVVVSAAKTQSSVSQLLDAGANVFLGKPVSAQELRHVIGSLIAQRESGKAGIATKALVGTAPLRAMPTESRRNSAVLFVAGNSDSPITLTVVNPISFGRSSNTGQLGDKSQHVNLSRYDAVNMGVSRVHMFLHYRDDKFFVEDADSINGTYVNGDPINPRTLVPVENADEIRLGQLRMYIYFLDDRDLGDETL